MNIAPAVVIAEIGCAHLGSMQRAKELITLAKTCGADYVKFQKRNPDECVPEALKNQPHPNARFAYGSTYLEHRKALELTFEEHVQLSNYAKSIGIKYTCSVWDVTSAREIVSINPDFIKIPSCCNHNNQIFDYLCTKYRGDIHISTGMTSHEDINRLLNRIFMNDQKRFVLYHCTSIYPCPFEKLHLLDISQLSELKRYGLRIGFSNHGYGIAADIAGWVLGAEFIERHFVDDRTVRHTDAAASLEPEGLRRLCRDLKNVSRAMSNSSLEPDELEKIEQQKLRKEAETS